MPALGDRTVRAAAGGWTQLTTVDDKCWTESCCRIGARYHVCRTAKVLCKAVKNEHRK